MFRKLASAAILAALVLNEWLPAIARGQEKTPPTATAEAIASWVADLDSGEYKTREAATQRLATAGEKSLDPLLAVANGDRLEPAERAIAILQEQARAEDEHIALPALHRLAQLRSRPQIAKKAESEIARITILACKRHLEALGAECRLQLEQVPSAAAYVPVFHVRFGQKWRGTPEDVRPLAELRFQPYMRLEGAAVDDAVLKAFETSPAVTWLQLWQSKVSVAAVNSLKEKRPNIEIYMRNRALMGVACENHEAGARVNLVEPGSAADTAGVLPGDVITRINGHAIPDFDRLTANVAQHDPGQQISIDVLRGEEKLYLKVTLGSWDLRPQR